MISRLFQSKSIVCVFLLIVFFFFISDFYLSGNALLSQGSQNVEDELQLGMDYYTQGKYDEAITHFEKVVSLTQDLGILTSAYLNLSVCYFFKTDLETAKEFIKKMLMLKPSKKAPKGSPSEYKKVFKKAKNELKRGIIQTSKEASVEVSEQAPNTRVQVGTGQKRKKKGLFLILGGVAAAAVVGTTVFFLTRSKAGSIQVNSTPSGALVSLDGNNTGQATPCTLADIEPGAHALTLLLDGYLDHQENVTVAKRETSTVNINLTGHNITVTDPNAEDILVKERNHNITWSVNSGSNGQVMTSGSSLYSSNIFMQKQMNSDFRSLSGGISKENQRRNSLQNNRRTEAQQNKNIAANRSSGSMKNKEAGYQENFIRNNGRDYSMRMLNIPATMNPLSQFTQPDSSNRNPKSIANMSIDLYRGTNFVRQIVGSTPNNGSYTWMVPSDVTDAGDYLVRIACSTENSIFGQSSQFWLTDVGSINCTSIPEGAWIYLDNVDQEVNTNTTLTDVPVGNKVVKYKWRRFKDYQTTVNVQKNQTHNVTKALEPDSFFEDFNGGRAEYWARADGSADWITADNVFKKIGTGVDIYEISSYDAGTAKFSGNFMYEAKSKIATGAGWHASGIAFGANADFSDYFLLDILAGDQFFSVWYVRNSGATQDPLLNWTSYVKINPTGWNTLKVVRTGNLFDFYINGIKVYSDTLAIVPNTGKIGLWTYSYEVGNETHYDDVRMTLNSPAPASNIGIEKAESMIKMSIGQKGGHPAFPPGRKIK